MIRVNFEILKKFGNLCFFLSILQLLENFHVKINDVNDFRTRRNKLLKIFKERTPNKS